MPVLTGFHIAGNAHELEDFGIMVWPDDGSGNGFVDVIWNDGNPLGGEIDVFTAIVHYALVPLHLVGPTGVATLDGYFGNASVATDALRPALRLFRMKYENGSRRVRRVGITAEPGEISWLLQDANGGEAVDFDAVWVEIP